MKKLYKSLLFILLMGIFIIPVAILNSNFIHYNNRQKMSVFATDDIVTLVAGDVSKQRISNDDNIIAALNELKDVYGFNDANEEFIIDKKISTAFGFTVRLKQVYRGLEVYGRGLNLAVNKNSEIQTISGNYLKGITIDTAADITIEEIVGTYENSGDLVISAQLQVFSLYEHQPTLAYNVNLLTDDGLKTSFINANTGELITEFQKTEKSAIPTIPVSSRQTDYFGNDVEVIIEKEVAGNTYYLADCLRNIYMFDYTNGSEAYSNSTGVFNDKQAITAFLNFIKCFDYYDNASNIGVKLRGVDGSVDNIHDNSDVNDEILVQVGMHYSSNWANAAYINEAPESRVANFVMGDGSPSSLFDLSTALDVVGHEYQHAVTAYSAGLIYLNASGALNEAISDMFGGIIEAKDKGYTPSNDKFWLCGEDITSPSYKNGAIRSAKNPEAHGTKSKFSQRSAFCFLDHDHDSSNCDNGGVHYNSTIITHAAYKMWEAQPAIFTLEAVGTLWYSALSLLPADCDFSDFRIILTQTANLLSMGNTATTAIGNAFNFVEVFGEAGKHTITFNRGNLTGELPKSMTVEYGDSFVIPATNLTLAGRELIGWSETGTTSSMIYKPGITYKMPGYNLDLKPVTVVKMWNNLEPTILEGTGNVWDPYLIQSERDLATLAYVINSNGCIDTQNFYQKYFRLTTNLDLKNITWIPINTLYQSWCLFFDGGGHYIENFKIDEKDFPTGMQRGSGTGLFGYLHVGEIKNLGIKNGNISVSSGSVGTFVGISSYVRIENCYSGVSINSNGIAGGIVGNIQSSNAHTLINCYNTGNVTGNIAGGIFGYRSLMGITNPNELTNKM